MAMSSLGVGSGLDLEGLVRQLVSVERQPREAALTRQQKENDVSLSAFSKLKSTLSDFQTSLTDLRSENELRARSATVSGQDEDNPILSATASSGAAQATYNISVEELAQGTKAKSGAFTGTDQVISASGGNLSFSTANGENNFSVAVGADATLQDIADAVNSSSDNFGVSASIVNTGGSTPETRLVFSSNITGAENALSVTNDNAELDAVSTVATGAGPAGMTVAAEDQARDARAIVDGITTYSSTNTFENAIEGLTFDAERAAPGEQLTLSVARDNEGVKEQVKGFVEAFNKVASQIESVTRTSTDESKRGALVGDSTVRSLQNSLNNIAGSAVGGDSAIQTLYSLGITFDEDGKLEMTSDGEERLDEALENNFDEVANVFAGENGIASRLDSLADDYVRTGGLIDTKEDIFESRKELLTQEREQFDRYMESYEKTLRERYQALDSTVAQLSSTSSYLAAQLGGLQ